MGKELSEMTLEELWALFPIILKEHDPVYLGWYEIQKEKLKVCLEAADIARISHIGSSVVPGLISKPTVDILLEVNKGSNINKITNDLESDGWFLMQSQKEPYISLAFNKGYNKDGYGNKVYHLHVRYKGDWNELYFRDYLMDHEDIAKAYGKLKLELLEKYKEDIDGYTHAKHDFVMKYTEEARKLYEGRYA